MFKRQQTILYMLERAGRPVGHLELVKWAFLLANETPTQGGISFYDFVPYHYGPFSFTLFREMNNLTRDGYVKKVKRHGHEAWERVRKNRQPMGNLSRNISDDTIHVVNRFINKPANDLLKYVYKHFPWYTANSRIEKLAQRPVAAPAVYTIGYEGMSIDYLLNTLMQRGIHRLVDVRRNPVARRYGFHKSSMCRLCTSVDIEYIHMPEVGISSELRRCLNGPEAYEKLFKQYESEFLPQVQIAIDQIADLVVDKATVLLCMEADPAMCHRTRLGRRIAEETGLPLENIQERKCEQIMN